MRNSLEFFLRFSVIHFEQPQCLFRPLCAVDVPQIECRTRSDHQRLRRRQFLIAAIIITVICTTLLTYPSIADYSPSPPIVTTLTILAKVRQTDRSDPIRFDSR